MFQGMRFRSGLYLATAAIGGFWCVSAIAQDAAPRSGISPQEDGSSGSDIVVTAQRRSENLSKVPVSISAFSGDMLARADVKSLQEVYSYTPNMAFNQSSGSAQIYLRGVGNNIANSSTDGSVAVNVDGVYVARPFGALLDFYDVERVEVLRGPQGTLYGRNATAGAINIVSVRPTRDLSGYVRAIYGSFDRRELQGAIGGPLTGDGSIRARIAGRLARDDGFTRDLDPRGSNKLDNQNVDALRGTLDADLGGFNVKLTADYTRQHSDGDTIRILDRSGQSDAVGAPVPGDFHEARNNLPTYNNNRSWGLAAEASYDFGPVSLISITGYRKLRQHFLLNTDGTEADVSESIFYNRSHQFSQELRLQSNGDSALRWIVGGYYFYEKVAALISLPRLSGAGTRPFPYSTIFDTGNNVKAFAGFADATYRFSDQFSASAGIRYSKEDKDIFRSLYSPSAIVRDVFDRSAFGTALAATKVSPSFDAWTPRFVLNFEPDGRTLFYLSVSRGFKSGGANQAAPTAAPFGNELLWSYEAGAKMRFWDNRAFLTASVFKYDYTDLQVTTFQNGLNVIQNAASAKPWGVEVELKLTPVPELQFNVSGSYLDAKYGDFISSLGGTAKDASGNRMINAPKWTGSASVSYDVHLGEGAGTLTLFGAVNYRSMTDFNQFGFTQFQQPAYALVDARIKWTAPGGTFSLSGFAKNLFDKDYVRNIASFTSITAPAYLATHPEGTATGYPGPGRQLGVEANFTF